VNSRIIHRRRGGDRGKKRVAVALSVKRMGETQKEIVILKKTGSMEEKKARNQAKVKDREEKEPEINKKYKLGY
jgi:predicted patatin/cPLA2 family phospholipase